MKDMARVIATTFIWGAFAGMMIAILVSSTGPMVHASGFTVMMVTGMLTAAASVGTYAVWNSGQAPDGSGYGATVNKAKRIRPTRMSDLIQTLNDDEVYELEELLLSHENEERLRNLR